MKKQAAIVSVTLLCLLMLSDVASAGILRRIRERRKAEIRNEVITEVNAKMEKDLAREVAAIRKNSEEHIAGAADRLDARVRDALEALKAQNSTQWAELGEKLQKTARKRSTRQTKKLTAHVDDTTRQQIQEALAKLNAQAEANEKKIADQLKTGIKQLTANLKKNSRKQTLNALAELTAKAEADGKKLEQQLKQGMAKILADAMASVKAGQEEMKAELNSSVKELVLAELKATQQEAPKPEEDPPAEKPEEKAALPQPVEREEEDASDETT